MLLHNDLNFDTFCCNCVCVLGRLAELSEWVDVMDSALEYRWRQFNARQKRCVLSSLEQKGGGVREVLKVLTLEDTRHLMAVYLNKVSSRSKCFRWQL